MPCKHKSKILTCKWCSQHICFNCVDLKAHECPEIAASVAAATLTLEAKLPKVIAPRVR